MESNVIKHKKAEWLTNAIYPPSNMSPVTVWNLNLVKSSGIVAVF